MSVVPIATELCRCLGSGQPPESIVVSKGHAATGAIMIWVVFAVTVTMMTDVQILPAAKINV